MPALNGVNFVIEPGEHVGVIGAVGSGKTTLERLLINLYQPESGSVQLDGVDVRLELRARQRGPLGRLHPERLVRRLELGPVDLAELLADDRPVAQPEHDVPRLLGEVIEMLRRPAPGLIARLLGDSAESRQSEIATGLGEVIEKLDEESALIDALCAKQSQLLEELEAHVQAAEARSKREPGLRDICDRIEDLRLGQKLASGLLPQLQAIQEATAAISRRLRELLSTHVVLDDAESLLSEIGKLS